MTDSTVLAVSSRTTCLENLTMSSSTCKLTTFFAGAPSAVSNVEAGA